MRSSFLLFTSASLLSNPANAWGSIAHETIARLAVRYLLPETLDWLNKLLPDRGSTDEGMNFISTWPDGFAHQCADGLWSKGLHFIDAEDLTAQTIKSPSKMVCSVDIDRDCRNGVCVVGAIQNYTVIIQQQSENVNQICVDQASAGANKAPNPPQNIIEAHTFAASGFPIPDPENLSDAELALRFLVHFIGDIHQPLHAEGYALGGNDIKPVYFNKAETNLHAAWDSKIPEAIFRRLPGGTNGTVDYLYQHTQDIDKTSDIWKTQWIGECFAGIQDEVAEHKKVTPARAEACALQWARWANHYICTYVLKHGLDTVGMELGGEYTNKAEPIIIELVSMAGWRLGGWLNLVATQKLGLDLGPEQDAARVPVSKVEPEVTEPEEDSYRGAHTTVVEHVRDEL